ncbi:hypothetical protein KKG46_03905 [Patescibacteria group bacterium]|nr:hypothetical protein [Patescibacteria group bacterium]
MQPSPIQPLMTHCPMCHSLYSASDIKLIKQDARVKLYHSTCRTCKHGLFAYEIEATGGMSSLGLVTDAINDDAYRLQQFQVVSAEECIEVHKLIFEQSRDLCSRLLDISGKLA